MTGSAASSSRAGLFWALASYLSWGAFPLYFHALAHVAPTEILAHRITWSAVFVAAIVTARGRWSEWVAVVRVPKKLATYALSTALITTNWLLYIWAVTSGHTLEASLGYFINPLVNVLLGVLILRETLRRPQILAFVIAAAGVLILVVRLGTIPWLALTLATSFGLYGLVRKRAAIDPVVGLLVETSLVAPFAAALIVARVLDGTSALGSSSGSTLLLLLAGVITALPLIWFARGVRVLRLSTMGLLQFAAPIGQFLCAVLVFHEAFTPAHAAAFGCIWAALALYTFDAVAAQRRPATAE